MNLKIWNWDYQNYIFGLSLLACAWVLVGLIGAKSNKPHTFHHLFSGICLILGGLLFMMLFDSGLALVKTLAGSKWIDLPGVAEANTQLITLKYFFPAVSTAFGTRFVGNWITAEKPTRQKDQTYSS